MMGEGDHPAWREVLRSATLSLLGRLVREPDRPFLRGLYFHSVYDWDRPHFERIIAKLSRLGSFIDTQSLLGILDGHTNLDSKRFHLSFDDGYRNLYRNALPVLRELKIPALVFVVTGMVGQDPLEGPDQRLMSWEELRTIQSWGFEVGSHTKTHAKLSGVSRPQDLDRELRDSKREIEQRLGTECRYIAWPMGQRGDVDGRFFEVVEAAGYRACFGGFRGSVLPGKTDRFRIPRHQLEASWPRSHVRYFATGHGE